MPRKRAALTEEERREIRAERKRQRHLWQTGASDKEKKKALDIALGGNKYAWMTQPASIPNIPMPAAGGPKAPTPRKYGGRYQPHPVTPGSSSPASMGAQSPATPANPALSSPGTPPTPITPAALALPKVSQPASKQGTKRKRGTQEEPIVVSSREASPIVIPSRDGSPEPPQTPLAKKAKLTESSAAEDDLANELEAAFEEERLAKALEEAFEEELEPDDPTNVDDDDDELAKELESALEEDRLAKELEEALEAPEDEEEAGDGNDELAKELEAALEGELDELFDEEVEEEDILAKELEEACAEEREKDELYHVLEHAWAFLTL